MNEELEVMGPCEGDYTLTPCGPLGSKIGLGEIGGKFLGTFADEDDAIYFIRERCAREKFYPNIWNVSDHGNWGLNSECTL